MRFWNFTCFILFLIITESVFAVSGTFGFEVVIQKPDNSFLQDPNVDFKFTVTDDSGACVIYSEEHLSIDMSGTNGQKTFQLGNTLLQTYPNPMMTTLTIDQVFSSSGVVYNCQGGGTYVSTTSASRKVIMEFNDGSGLQTLPALAINSVPYAVEAQKVVSNSITTQNILDGTITSSDLSSMGASAGQVMKWDGSAWVASNDETGVGGTVTNVTASSPLSSSGGGTPNITIAQANGTTSGYLSSADFTTFAAKLSDFSTLTSADITGKLGYTPVNPAIAVISVAGRTGAVTLSSADITGISFGTTSGTFAQGNDPRFTDERNPINDSVTSAKIADGAIQSADLSAGSVTLDKLNQSSASTGQVIKWNGSAWVASSDETGAGGTVTNVTASSPLSSSGGGTPNITIAQANGATSGYLSSADFTTFAAKLSDFSTLTSGDITGKLGYTPLANFTSMTSTDVTTALGYTPVNPSAAVISVAGRTGVVTLSSSDISGLGTLAGKNQVNLSIDVTGDLPLTSIAQSSATTGQIIKWNGSSWIVSDDSSGLADFSTLTSADITGKLGYTPLANFASMTSADVTTALGYTPLSPSTSFSGDISGVYNNITVNNIKNIPVTLSSLTSGDIVQYNGSAFVNRNIPTCAANQYLTFNGTSYSCAADVGASGTVASINALTGALNLVTGTSGTNFNIDTTGATITLNLPTASSANRGLLSSADWSTFNSKLSDFSTLTSADITGKLGYTPVNPSTAVISVAGRTGAVTLSSADITGISFGTTSGTFAEGNDSRLTDERTPINNSVTSAKIVDGTITSADISAGAITFDKLNQSSATTGQVIKWDGSAWVVSDDNSSAGTVTSVTASGPLSSSGGATPNISITQANGTTSGYLSSSDWSLFNAKLSDFSTLTSADITGKLGYTPLANFSSMISTDVTNALGYVPANIGSVILASQMPANCGVGQTLTFSSPTGSWLCSNIILANDSVLSAMISSLDWSKVANRPSTLAGYGISMSSSDITTALTYTPVNRAGDTMTGALNLPSNGLAVGSNQLVVSGGNVGIGTASPNVAGWPDTTLTISGRNDAANAQGIIELVNNRTTAASADKTGTLNFVSRNNAGAEKRTAIIQSVLSGSGGVNGFGGTLYFNTKQDNATTTNIAMTINDLGNVGIGTSSPSYKLDVAGDVNITGNFKVNGVNISSGGGMVTSVTSAGAPIVMGGTSADPTISITQANGTTSGYLSSADWTLFNAKLSDFSTLTSADITGKLGYTPLANYGSMTSTDVTTALGYTPVNPATAVISVAGRTGVVTLSSADISGISFGAISGTFAEGNDSRLTDERTPINNSVTSAKIVDGTITSADISAGAITFDKLNQSSATTGQVIKWDGSAWIASSDSGLSSLTSTDITTALTYTPVNRAGDTMTGSLNLPSNGLTVGTNQLVVSGGNIGVGSTTPETAFQVGNLSTGTSSPAKILAADYSTDSTGDPQFMGNWASTGLWGIGMADSSTATVKLGVVDYPSMEWSANPIKFVINGSVGIGTATPGETLTISKSGSNATLMLEQTDSGAGFSTASLGIANYGGTSGSTGAYHQMTSSRGSKASPTPLQTNDTIAVINARTRPNAGNDLISGAIEFVASENHGALSVPAHMYLRTTPSGSFTPTTRISILSSGQVGIGLTNPSYALDVSGDVNVTGVFRVNGSAVGSGTVTAVTASSPLSSSGGTSPNLTIARATASADGYLASTDWTTFNSKLSDFSTLTSADITGKLGYTPLANYGSMTSTDVTTALGYTPVNPATAVISVAGRTGVVTLSSSDISGLGTLAGKSTIVSADLSAGSVTFDKLNQSSATTGQVIKWDGSAWIASSDSGLSSLTSTDITTALTYTPVNRAGDTMTGALNLPSNGLAVGTDQLVVSSGNVGIGTSSPGSKLTISEGDFRIANETASGTDVQIDNHFDSSEGPFILLRKTRGTKAAQTYSQMGDSLGSINFQNKDYVEGASITASATSAHNVSTANTSLIFKTTSGTVSQTRMIIDEVGRVSIGIPSPSYSLDVSGDVNVTGNFRVNGSILGSSQWTTSGSHIYYNSGNVGIGTSTPNFKLELAGVSSNDGTIGINGQRAFYLPDQTTFIGSLFIGDGGAHLTNSGGTDGQANTGAGLGALYFNESGHDNAAVGKDALYSNTSGSQNTAVGSGALYSNTSPNDNTAIGYSALYSNISGSDNVAVGSWAMYSTDSGYGNAALGSNVMYNNVDGGANTAVGQEALGSNRSKSDSTAVGYLSMKYADNTSSWVSSYNTAIGAFSLRGSTTPANNTGIQNTALGHSALMGMTSGSGNIGIGYNSGSSITTGSNNIIIGSNTGSTIATSSNNILIADGAGNERIRVNSSGQVGIGTNAPTSVLTVSGDTTLAGTLAVNATTGVTLGGTNLTNQTVRFHNMTGMFYYGGTTFNDPDSGQAYDLKLGGSLKGLAVRGQSTFLNRVGFGVTSPSYSVDVSGDVNVTGNFKVNGVNISSGSGTVNSGTINKMAFYSATGTAVSSNANVTMSNGVMTLGQSGSVIGGLGLAGNTSGTVSINPQATAGTYNFNLPTTAGTSGQVLTSGGGAAAPMTWLTLANSASVDTTNASNISSGTLASGRLPAFTGDVTTSAGSSATTIATSAVTSAKILDGTIASSDISAAAITFDKLNQSSATTGQVIKWSGSAWIASADSTGGGGGLPASGGSAAAPGYAFSGDTNTGIFSSIADTLSFSTAGNEIVTIKPTGKIGINNTDPYFDLELNKSDNDVFMAVSHGGYGTGTYYSGFYANHYMGPSNAGTSRVVFNVYRGAGGSPAAVQTGDTLGEFLARGGSDTSWSVADGASISFAAEGNFSNTSSPARVVFSTTPTGSTGLVERMRIDSSGNVGIGTISSAGSKLDVIGNVRFLASSSDAEGVKIHTSYSGNETSSRVLLAERQDDAYGWSLATAGVVNPTLGGTTLTGLPAGTFNIVRHDGSAIGASALSINRTTGNVGIGNTDPRATLDVTGVIVSRASQSFAAGTIDFSVSNLRHTTQNCGSFALHNLKDGGTYMFAVQGTTVATCSFTAFSDAGSTALTVHMPPDHGATTSGKHTIYNIAVMGTHAYIAWTPGY